MGDETHGENPRNVYPAPGHYIRDWGIDGNAPWTADSGKVYGNAAYEKAERDGFSEKVCRLQTKPRKWQAADAELTPGASLHIDDVRNAWPYEGGGSYDTIAAGEQGH
jgi:hypothetical protein